MMTDKIVEKKLPSGKRKLMLQDLHGHDLEGVYLKGMRNRPWPIARVDERSFYERVPKDEHGQPSEDGNFMRGIPVMFYQQGWTIHLWPAPFHDWIIQFRLRRKDRRFEVSCETR